MAIVLGDRLLYYLWGVEMLESLEFLRGLKKIPLNETNACKHIELRGKGIYAIFVETNNRIYIGSASKSFLRRFRQHRSQLKRGIHHTAGLQNAVNKHGLSCLTFAVVEVLDTSERQDILDREQAWIDAIPPSIKLNVCLVAGSCAGRPYPDHLRRIQSDHMKALFAKEPERLQQMMDGMQEWLKNPENIEKRRQQGLKNITLHREKLSQGSRTPQRRAQASIHAHKLWAIKSHRAFIALTMQQEWADPDARQKRCEAIKKKANTPENKDRVSKQFKDLFECPEYRKKNREHLTSINRKNAQKTGVRTKALWADSSYKEKTTQSIISANSSKNNPSIIISPDQIKYVTDSISRFAKEFKLTQSLLNRTIRGDQPKYKGWTGYPLSSWAEVPNDAIRILWGDHPDLPVQIEAKQESTPIQLSLDI